MTLWRLHSCPTCGGDGFRNEEEKRWDCLQCGRTVARDEPTPTTETPGHMGRPGVRQSGLWEQSADLEPMEVMLD